MMMNNNVGFHASHVTTTNNVIADRIFRLKCESHSMRGFESLLQEYPELAGCKRFQPCAELISHIMDAILLKKSVDPMEVNSKILTTPGHVTS